MHHKNSILRRARALLAPIALGIAALSAGGAHAQAPIAECAGIPATIFVNADGFVVGGPLNGQRYAGKLVGTADADVILGTPGADIIQGLGGDDLICGQGGRDKIFGGQGDDLIDGGAGADQMNGGPGNDTARKVQAGDKRIACEVNAAIPPFTIALAPPVDPVVVLEGAIESFDFLAAFTNVHASIVAEYEVEVSPANGGLVAGVPGTHFESEDDEVSKSIVLQAVTPGEYTLRVRLQTRDSSVFDEFEIPVVVDANDGDANITVSQGAADFVLEAGEVRNITYVVSFDNPTGPCEATFTQSVVGDAGGILIDSDAPSQISFTTSRSFVFNTICTAVLPGEYSIESLVTITTSGRTANASLGATIVLPGQSVDEVFLPTLNPPAAKENVATPVVVRAAFSTTGAAPVALQAQETEEDGTFLADLAELRDDGVAPDDLAGDGIYSGQAEVNARPEGEMFVIVRAPGGAVSGASRLLISPFDNGVRPSDEAKLLEIEPGVQVFGEEIVVAFEPGTPSATVAAAAALVGGSVQGMLSLHDIYQFSIPGADTAEELNAAKATLEALPEVDAAQANGVSRLNDFQPDDPGATWFFDARLNEARIVASGSAVAVAVIDTGVDVNQIDLVGRLLPGSNMTVFPTSTDVTDEADHGTGVASLIASPRNGGGVTGASDARIIPIKATNPSGSLSQTMLAHAIDEAVQSSARLISISISGPAHIAKERAVQRAHDSGKLIIASSGNDGDTRQLFPCAYPTVLCVGAMDGESIAAFSNRGAHVDIAAQGKDIVVAQVGNAFGPKDGTSFSTPIVSGIAALVLGRQPGLTHEQLREILEKTASPVTQAGVGAGVVDAFAAVFNGGFELQTLNPWAFSGTVGPIQDLGEITPREGKLMCMLTTGPAGDQVAASMQQSFTIQPGVTDPVTVSMQFAFVTEEFPEFVGTQFDDNVRIVLVSSGGQEFLLGSASVNGSAFQLLPGVDFPGGDSTVGWTGWQAGQATIPNAGGQTFRIEVRDAGDDVFDSVVLIDDIRFQ